VWRDSFFSLFFHASRSTASIHRSSRRPQPGSAQCGSRRAQVSCTRRLMPCAPGAQMARGASALRQHGYPRLWRTNTDSVLFTIPPHRPCRPTSMSPPTCPALRRPRLQSRPGRPRRPPAPPRPRPGAAGARSPPARRHVQPALPAAKSASASTAAGSRSARHASCPAVDSRRRCGRLCRSSSVTAARPAAAPRAAGSTARAPAQPEARSFALPCVQRR
jgi:hypothetical protein